MATNPEYGTFSCFGVVSVGTSGVTRYGDRSPCFITGSLVVYSYVSEVIRVPNVRVNLACFQCRRGTFYVFKLRFSFFIFVLK